MFLLIDGGGVRCDIASGPATLQRSWRRPGGPSRRSFGIAGVFFVLFLFLFCRGSQGAPTGVVPGGEEMKDGPVESVLPSSPAGTQRRNFVPIAPLTVNGTPRTSRAHSLLY